MARGSRTTPAADASALVADTPAADASALDVVATARGYYGHLREVGAEFALKDEAHFSKRWMRRRVAESADDLT